jgi:hypothetical protein
MVRTSYNQWSERERERKSGNLFRKVREDKAAAFTWNQKYKTIMT